MIFSIRWTSTIPAVALSDGRFDQSIVARRPNPNLGFAAALDFRGLRPITLNFHSLHSILLSIYHFTPPLILRVTPFTHVTYLCQYLAVYHYLSYSSHLYPSFLPLLALLGGGYTCHYLGYSLNHTCNPIILYYILGLTGFRVCPYSVTLSLFGHASDACPY